MVSTRGARYKFSEGERVLCYEPDPTKAKVLYDSKVLEVIENKDKRGRRTVEYLIHFQGWNSSWDRCVSEDFVLKDTEENRQLQRDLAEKSQLQLGAYLYRRERKKTSSGGASAAKRARLGFSDDGSSSSPRVEDAATEVETGDTDSSSVSYSSPQPRTPPPLYAIGRAHITLPPALRDRLTFDYHLITKRGLVTRVPAVPCAARVLTAFVKWFARAGAWRPPARKHDAPHRPDLLDVSCRLNLIREVADGLRVYFDFILRTHLLYKQEFDQYHVFCGQYYDSPISHNEMEMNDKENHCQDNGNIADTEEEEKSPKTPEYSHLPPDPVEDTSNGDVLDPNVEIKSEKSDDIKNEDNAEENREDSLEDNREDDFEETREDYQEDNNSIEDFEERSEGSRCAQRTSKRRLRSQKSGVSHSENEDPTPSTSTEDIKIRDELYSEGSSSSDERERAVSPTRPPGHTRTALSQLLDKVAKWQLIPRAGTERLPCRVYGAIHLARLFVKLPDFLNATQMPDFKLKLISKYIDMFVQYLDEHSEWFGEAHYVPATQLQ